MQIAYSYLHFLCLLLVVVPVFCRNMAACQVRGHLQHVSKQHMPLILHTMTIHHVLHVSLLLCICLNTTVPVLNSTLHVSLL